MLNQRNSFKVSPLMGLILLGLVLFFIYIIFKGLFALASTIMPVLAIATIFIDYKVYVSFGKTLVNLLKSNILLGLGAVALTFIAFPLVILFLFSKALIKRFALKSVKDNPLFQEKKHEDEYLDYEEIEVEAEDIPMIELPPVEPKKAKTEKNPFDDYFN